MSIAGTLRRAGPYTTDGAQTDFSFAFKVFNEEDVLVVTTEDGVDTELTHVTDYSVLLNADQDASPGGTITTVATYDGPELTVISNADVEQPTVFTNSGGFYARVLNDSLDRVTIFVQQIAEKLTRVPLLPLGTPPVGQFPVTLANGSFGWSTGTGSDAALRSDLATDGGPLIAVGETTLEQITVKTPFQYGAVLSGLGDSTDALQAFLDALGDGVHGRWEGGPYTISSRLELIDKSNFQITGQCTVQIADGTATGEAYSALLVQNCSDFVIEGLVADGNRDGRTPAEASGHLIQVKGGSNGVFRRCKAINATTDGWYVRGTDPATLSTYPTDITFEDCGAENSYRNGSSIIGAVRPRVIRGRYVGANGTAPQAGIDFEPNVSDVFGVIDPYVEGVEVSDNMGVGLFLTGNGGSGMTENALIVGLRGSNNQGAGGASGYGALIHISTSKNSRIMGTMCGDHPTTVATGTKGLIQIESTAEGVVIDGATFKDITTTNANVWCIRANSAVKSEIRNIKCDTIACGAVSATMNDGVVDGVTVINSTFAGISVSVAGTRNKVANVLVNGHAAGTYAGYFTGAFHTFRNLKAQDTVATNGAFRFDSNCTDADIDGVNVHATTAVPAGNALRIDAAPLALRNVTATKETAATGSWTTSNLIFSSAGLLAPTIMAGMSPDVLSNSSTYDPPSVAGGASTTTNISVSKASVGDRAVVIPPTDLGGLILSVPPVSTNGRVDFSLFNPTAGAIDLASGTWRAMVLKA